MMRVAADGVPSSGRTIIIPTLSMGKKYLSTLQESYYETEEGAKVLSLIREYNPSIYVELHCYRHSAFSSLTSLERLSKTGVPPMVELEEKMLLGSVSPHLLSRFKFEFSLVLEVPCRASLKTKMKALRLLNFIKNSENWRAVLEKFKTEYPHQLEKASRLLRGWLPEGVGARGPPTKSNSENAFI